MGGEEQGATHHILVMSKTHGQANTLTKVSLHTLWYYNDNITTRNIGNFSASARLKNTF